jgi:hypothetical protein
MQLGVVFIQTCLRCVLSLFCCIYAEIKLNCVKLNNIEISIQLLRIHLPSRPSSNRGELLFSRAHCIFERFMAYALNNFRSLHGINVRLNFSLLHYLTRKPPHTHTPLSRTCVSIFSCMSSFSGRWPQIVFYTHASER